MSRFADWIQKISKLSEANTNALDFDLSELSNNKLSLIDGKIRIKDQEISMQIPMFIVLNSETAIAVGQLEIDRTLFGIVYGSSSYFSDLADRAINDNFLIKFSIIANKVSDE